ncbi:prepilin peptidase [Microbacterium tenebrionis]|uniref:prepilin peptidase n=1 Tax=Microbacterium tenebrionis TaxID=2830665 RepID=UPI00202B2AF3|nr:A24 family peptidase [Microbacterium ihumii]
MSAVLIVLATALTGEPARLISAGVGLVALGGLYLLLALGWRDGMGWGDVKLAGALGLTLGWRVAALIVGGFSAFVIGGIVGAVLIATRKAGRKSGVPFGPFMIIGAWTGVFAGAAIADLYLSAVGLA